MSNKDIADLFSEAATEHTMVEAFKYGNYEYLFNENSDLEYPAIFLQKTTETLDGSQRVRGYTLYSIQQRPDDFNNPLTPFEYDEVVTEARDASWQVLRDVYNKVKLENRQTTLFTDGNSTFDNEVFDGAVAYLLDFTITTIQINNANNFPS